MSCQGCGVGFGFLKKEIGCEKCGFCFCSRCCKKQTVPTSTGEIKKLVVCNKCYQELTSESKDYVVNVSPPMAHKKRMEALKNRSFSVDSHNKARSDWSNATDKVIAERLQLLKRDRVKNLPSEEEIAHRLAILKGMDPAKYNAPPIEVYRPDKRTSTEKTQDLLKQFTDMVAIESKIVKPQDEIAARLAALRDLPPPPTPPQLKDQVNIASDSKRVEQMDLDDEISEFALNTAAIQSQVNKELEVLHSDPEYKEMLLSMEQKRNESNNEENEMTEEEEADKLVEELLAQDDSDFQELDSLKDNEASTPSEDPAEEEFPWCVICNEDAKVRCFGCDSDLYCMRCYRECHDSLDITDHKTCPYLQPRVQAS